MPHKMRPRDYSTGPPPCLVGEVQSPLWGCVDHGSTPGSPALGLRQGHPPSRRGNGFPETGNIQPACSSCTRRQSWYCVHITELLLWSDACGPEGECIGGGRTGWGDGQTGDGHLTASGAYATLCQAGTSRNDGSNARRDATTASFEPRHWIEEGQRAAWAFLYLFFRPDR